MTLPFAQVRSNKAAPVLGLTLLLALLVRHASEGPNFLQAPEWPHQASMFDAGHYLREHQLHGRIGSWNAGIIGYYQGGEVVNLDGLVNNDIHAYAERNDLPTYIHAQGIEHLLDFEAMIESSDLRRRGGYDVPEFLATLRPVHRFDDASEGWHSLTLFDLCERATEPGGGAPLQDAGHPCR